MFSIRHPCLEEFFGVFVDEVDVAAFEGAAEEDAVGVFDEGEEFFGILDGADGGVGGVLGVAFPGVFVEAVFEVGAEDDADVVEFEALDCVDASDLVDGAGVEGPEGGGRDVGRQGYSGFLAFPGHGEVADLDVLYEGSVLYFVFVDFIS